MGKALGPCSCSVRVGHLSVEFDQRLYYSIGPNLESCFHFCLHRSHQNEVPKNSCCARDGHTAGSLQSELRPGTGSGRSTGRGARRASSGSGRTRSATGRARTRARSRSVTDQSNDVSPRPRQPAGVCCLVRPIVFRRGKTLSPSDRALVDAIPCGIPTAEPLSPCPLHIRRACEGIRVIDPCLQAS
jgi:hypothetical protein